MKNSKKKILVVDDSEVVRNFHSYIIKMLGYEVATVENGFVASEKLFGEEYNLLITDPEKLVKTIKMLL